MLDNGKISVRQFTILVMLITIGDSILVLPSIIALEAKQDAWISSLIGVAAGLLIVYMMSMVGKFYPNLTLVQSIQKILGNWFGTLVALLFLIYPLISSAADMRELGDFVTTEMMPETPIQAIQILFVCIVIMAVRLGLEVIGRAGEIFLPSFIILFLLMIIFLSPQAKIENLQPILENGMKPVLNGALTFAAFPFMELISLLMIIPYVKQAEKIRKGFLQGALLAGIVLIVIMTISILVLGQDLTSRNIYPSYSLAKKISVGHFIDRVEVIIALMWILTHFFKITFYFYIFNLGLAQLLKLKENKMLILPTGMTVVALASIIAPNITYYNLVIIKYWPFIDLTYGVFLPLLLLVVYFIRKEIKGTCQ